MSLIERCPHFRCFHNSNVWDITSCPDWRSTVISGVSLFQGVLISGCSYFRGVLISWCPYFRDVLISGVSLFQGSSISGVSLFQEYPYFRMSLFQEYPYFRSVLISGCPYFRGVLISECPYFRLYFFQGVIIKGLHCNRNRYFFSCSLSHSNNLFTLPERLCTGLGNQSMERFGPRLHQQ